MVARRLATSPHDTILTPNMADAKTGRWHHGKSEAWNSANLCEPAIRVLTSRPPVVRAAVGAGLGFDE